MKGKLRNMTSLYLLYKDQILLLYRVGSRVVNQLYIGSTGGHFEKEELNDAKACIIREMNEEIGLRESDIDNLQLRYITLRLKNDEVRQNYYFFAELKDKSNLKSNEGELTWVDIENALDYEMPFSARYVIENFINTGRYTEHLYGGIATNEGLIFSKLEEF